MSNKNRKLLFKEAVRKYGALEENEIFGFEPAIILGGEIALHNIKKLDCAIHLMILRQLAEPAIFEI